MLGVTRGASVRLFWRAWHHLRRLTRRAEGFRPFALSDGWVKFWLVPVELVAERPHLRPQFGDPE
jgi:hypothetical protein